MDGSTFDFLPECADGSDKHECTDKAGIDYLVDVLDTYNPDGGCGTNNDGGIHYYCEGVRDGKTWRRTDCECQQYDKVKAMTGTALEKAHPWNHYKPADESGKCCDWYMCWYGHGDIYCCDDAELQLHPYPYPN